MLNIQFMQQSPLTVKIHHFLHKTFRILTSYDQSFFYCQAIAFIWLILHCKNIFSISLQELSSHFLDKYIKMILRQTAVLWSITIQTNKKRNFILFHNCMKPLL